MRARTPALQARQLAARRGFARVGLMAALLALGCAIGLSMVSPANEPTCPAMERGMIGCLVDRDPTDEGYFRIDRVLAGMPARAAGVEDGDLITRWMAVPSPGSASKKWRTGSWARWAPR